MLECPDFTFSSAPKTGCQWVRSIMSKPLETGVAGVHSPGTREGKPSISHVRDPADWLRSYFQGITNAIGYPPVDRFHLCREGMEPKHVGSQVGFRVFATRCLEKTSPNSIHDMFLSYPADERYRVEDQPSVMELRLNRSLRGMKTFWNRHRFSVPDEIRALIYKHEPRLCAAFGYGE